MVRQLKTITATKAKKKAWDAFSKYIRLRDAIKTTHTKTHLLCITCGRRYKAFGKGCAQAGHFISGRNNSILLDEKFVNGQCPICNKWMRGNYVRYEIEMIKMWGKKAVDEVKARSLLTVQVKAYEWLDKEQEYKEKYDKLKSNTMINA